jgi:TetR/AcrR family transcriptional regulator, transcriptional repressor for nem operon
VIRTKGYAAATVDDICLAAGVTKGSFFHHFSSKEDLGLAAAAYFSATTDAAFAAAPYHRLTDPRERLLGYIDFRLALLRGGLAEFTCLLGAMVQDTYTTHPAIRDACNTYISSHAANVAADVVLAKQQYAPDAPWSPESLALFTQTVLQGAFVLAKARNGPKIATESLTHLRRYIEDQLPLPRRLAAR